MARNFQSVYDGANVAKSRESKTFLCPKDLVLFQGRRNFRNPPSVVQYLGDAKCRQVTTRERPEVSRPSATMKTRRPAEGRLYEDLPHTTSRCRVPRQTSAWIDMLSWRAWHPPPAEHQQEPTRRPTGDLGRHEAGTPSSGGWYLGSQRRHHPRSWY